MHPQELQGYVRKLESMLPGEKGLAGGQNTRGAEVRLPLGSLGGKPKPTLVAERRYITKDGEMRVEGMGLG